MGSTNRTLTPTQAGQSSESYLATQPYYCDWTRNSAMINGSYMAVRNDRYGTLQYNCH